MEENIWNYTSSFMLPSVELPASKVAALLSRNKGIRIGQSAVVSRNMHTFSPNTPEKVNVLQAIDAGQAFYQRKESGTVCHVDVFHECGKVDHHLVATYIKRAVAAYNLHFSVSKLLFYNHINDAVDADYIDIQTGTGGGRLTGSLTYGQKLSLRRAHENHVHIALVLANEHTASLFYIVLAVEDAIIASGLEIRRNEEIIHIKGSNGKGNDMSPYADKSDSFMQEKDLQNTPVHLRRRQFTQDAVVLADNFDTVNDVRDILTHIDTQSDKKELEKEFDTNGNVQQMISALVGLGMIEVKGKNISLTKYGQEFRQYLNTNMVDLQAYIRQMLKSLKPDSRQCGNSNIWDKKNMNGSGPQIVMPFNQSTNSAQFAAAETVMAAAQRKIQVNSDKLCFEQSDLRVYLRKRQLKSEILLLIDASASMKGQRILAAKFLVRHLLLSTPDKIGVITFQDSKAAVDVPFTRDFQQIEESLRNITVTGATPLALGLKICLNYLRSVKTNNPLIILLTDGVPTLADMSRDPIADALVYAKDIKEAGYGFMGIGLKPHRNYLTKLADIAGGKAYLLDELEKQVLVNAAWLERGERCL